MGRCCRTGRDCRCGGFLGTSHDVDPNHTHNVIPDLIRDQAAWRCIPYKAIPAQDRDEALGKVGKWLLTYWVYILSNRPRGAIYAVMTNNLQKRVWQHREGEVRGYTSRYSIPHLVYFEPHDESEQATSR